MTERLYSCPWCESEDIYTLWPETQWYQCRSCSLLFRNPMPTKEELNDVYDRSWSAPKNAMSETGGTDERLAKIYARKLANSLQRKDFRELKILDFGAGRGSMLKALRELGAETYGVEPYGYEYLQEQGFEAYRDLSEVNGTFDGVIMIEVFEHLHRPWMTIKELYNSLAECGWIYISTPNPLGVNARIARGNWREAKKPGHIVFGTPRLMEQVLQWASFRRIKRLRWFIRYSRNPLKRVLHASTQMMGVDGALRYLAWK